jgi:hypothetical protein
MVILGTHNVGEDNTVDLLDIGNTIYFLTKQTTLKRWSIVLNLPLKG